MAQKRNNLSKWSSTTKGIIVVILLILTGALIIRFSELLPIVAGGLIISSILQPAVRFLNQKLKIPWGLGTALLIILLVLLFLGAIIWGGVSIIDQIQGLINFLLSITNNVTEFINNLSDTVLKIGPWELDLSIIDWDIIGQNILEYAQPLLSALEIPLGILRPERLISSGSFSLP